jgi:type I restriction enzyme S subunit
LTEGSRKPAVGDLILSRNATVGEIAQVAGWHPPFAMGQDVCLLRKKRDDYSTDFLQSVFKSRIVHSQLDELMVGSTFRRVNVRQVKHLIIPMPRPDEQKAIAAALSDVDRMTDALGELIAKKQAIKLGTMQQLLAAKDRLPRSEGKLETFNQVFEKLNAKPYQIKTSEYLPHGLYPVIDQGKNPIVGFSDQTEKLFRCPPNGIIVFGDHTRIIKHVTNDFIVGADGTQLLAVRGRHIAKFLYYQLLMKEIPNTGYNRHFKFLRQMSFTLPTPQEQSAIAMVLSDMDDEIGALERRREKTKSIKQGMLQVLLSGRIRLVRPEV